MARAGKADNSKLFSDLEPRWSASMNYNTEPGHAASALPNYSDRSHCARRFGRHFERRFGPHFGPGRMWTKATRRWRLQEAISRRWWRYKDTFEPPQRRLHSALFYIGQRAQRRRPAAWGKRAALGSRCHQTQGFGDGKSGGAEITVRSLSQSIKHDSSRLSRTRPAATFTRPRSSISRSTNFGNGNGNSFGCYGICGLSGGRRFPDRQQSKPTC